MRVREESYERDLALTGEVVFLKHLTRLRILSTVSQLAGQSRTHRLELPLSGSVAEIGEQMRIPVPRNRTVTDILALYGPAKDLGNRVHTLLASCVFTAP